MSASIPHGREGEAAELCRQRGEGQDAVQQDREEADQEVDDHLGVVPNPNQVTNSGAKAIFGTISSVTASG